MKYKFSSVLNSDYNALKEFIDEKEEVTKYEFLDKCSGKIPFDLLQLVRELEFEFIGKDEDGELYLS
ncbi:MAG: hypothetical protein ACM3VS_16585 [Candidatus Dadabacteria bacterium]